MLRLAVLCLLVATTLAEEEEKPSPEAVAIAATLLGAISFIMSLFYLTNHSDADMRRYTYQVISATISIFCAVLLFASLNDLVQAYLLAGVSIEFRLLIDFLILVFWYFVLQFVLALSSGAISELFGWKQRPMEQIEANIKCFAVLLAHITAFASINFWSSMQQTAAFSWSPLTVLLTVPISILGQLMLQRVMRAIRERITLSDDGQEDDHEKLWDEETADAENDVAGLTLSWQTIQAARFLIGGALPNAEGEEPFDALSSHGSGEVLALLLLAMAFAIAVFRLLLHMENNKEQTEAHKRVLNMTVTVLSMGFAWSFFFGFDWLLASFKFTKDEMMLSVVLAIVLFAISFVVIRLLDKLYDADWTGDSVDAAIQQIIGAIGILIGFAWEQCFDHATMSLSLVMPMPHVSKLLLAIFCAVILVPAWRLWILPFEIEEGWRFGFVIRPDEHQWLDVISHDKFHQVMEVLDLKVQERRSSGQVDDVPSQRLSRMHQQRESLRGVSTSGSEQQRGSAEEGQYVRLPGNEKDASSQEQQIDALKRKTVQLEKALTNILSSYHEHLDTVDGTLERVQNAALPHLA